MALAHQQEAEAVPERILVLDDDPEICELTQAYLQQQGFEVDTVQSGEALNSYLQDHTVDLLVLDLMLPGEHGLTIAQRVKKDLDLPIIIISAQGDDVDRIVGLDKPINVWVFSRACNFGPDGSMENGISLVWPCILFWSRRICGGNT